MLTPKVQMVAGTVSEAQNERQTVIPAKATGLRWQVSSAPANPRVVVLRAIAHVYVCCALHLYQLPQLLLSGRHRQQAVLDLDVRCGIRPRALPTATQSGASAIARDLAANHPAASKGTTDCEREREMAVHASGFPSSGV